MKSKKIKLLLLSLTLLLALIASTIYYYVFSPIIHLTETAYLYIDRDDTADSVYHKLEILAAPRTLSGLKTIARYKAYPEGVKTGRYAIEPGMNALDLFRRLRGGMQVPIRITVPSARTMDRLAGHVARGLMIDSAEVATALYDNMICETLGYDTTTIYALFIPNTYELYWDISVERLLQRMKREHASFWNEARLHKAKGLNLDPIEVVTLASIIDEETAYDPEKARVAGMYLNRLEKGMPLQADPTIKFALKQFDLKRIYYDMLTYDSPYNTYLNKGLPPGPIRIATLSSIEAVLNAEKHHYLYMCAKEDFSGSHNFARTYNEHLRNATRYRNALNSRKIK